MKPSLKKLQQFIENNAHFSSLGAQSQAKDLLQKILSDFNGSNIVDMPRRTRPMRVFCFMI